MPRVAVPDNERALRSKHGHEVVFSSDLSEARRSAILVTAWPVIKATIRRGVIAEYIGDVANGCKSAVGRM
jgi:hypothetical protein